MLSTIIVSKKGNDISTKSIISKFIESCIDEQDIDKKIETLYRIHSILPKFPKITKAKDTIITNDYVGTSLYNKEQTQII